MITRIALIMTIAALSITAFANPESEEATQTEEAANSALIVTSEGWLERCMLPLVITSVDGEEISEDPGRYELEAGSHSFKGYAKGDFTACETIAAAGIGADEVVGEGSVTVDIPAGKDYYLGLDVRKPDRSTWRIVTWKISHN